VGRAAGVLARLLDGRPVAIRTGPAKGLLLRSEPRSVAWLTGKVEPDVQAALGRFLHGGAIFVDVGASIGFHSILAARLVGPEGTVLAFEPSAAGAASIRANAAANGCGNVRVASIALSDSIGGAWLVGAGEATAHLVRPGQGGDPVAMTTLDTYLGARPFVPTLVKIDVEGHEDAVLRGMHLTLRSARPAVIVELHGPLGFLETLDQADYRTAVLGRGIPPQEAPPGAHVLALPPARPPQARRT
jgi:FkbM family methyltransferase